MDSTWARALSQKLEGVAGDSAAQLAVLARALDLMPVGVVLCDARSEDLPLVYVNQRFCDLTGYSPAEVLGRNCRFLQRDDFPQHGTAAVQKLLRERIAGQVLVRNYRKDGTLFHNKLTLAPIHDAAGTVVFYLGVQDDITDEVEAVRRLNPLDPMTGLPHRAAILEHLTELLRAADHESPARPVEVLVLDVDDFKVVNSRFGFAFGDACIKMVGQRLAGIAPPGAMVGRIGGVQFVCVYRAPDAEERVADLGMAFMDAVERPQEVVDPIDLTLSVGTATFPADGADAETLVQKAKVAMHHARASGVRVPLPYADMLT